MFRQCNKSLISFSCVRSFFGSKLSKRPNIAPISIPEANLSKDDLQTNGAFDADFDVSSDQ